MGLTKQYLAYKQDKTFNIIASGRPNINFLVYNNIEGRYVVVGGAENALVWDLKIGEKILTFERGKEEVTAIRASPDDMHVAVGYSDGVVEIFEISSSSSICTMSLHKTAISVLRYDSLGVRLVSGGLDTELVVSDMVALTGKQRLIGHNAPITDAHFYDRLGVDDVVVSSSKDTQIRFWNLETQVCFKILVNNRTEVWALTFVNNLMFAGTGENNLCVYRIQQRASDTNLVAAVEGLSLDLEEAISPITVTNYGVIQRAGTGRTVNLLTDPTEKVVSCHGTNGIIENFYICPKEEATKRFTKRLRNAQKSGVASESQYITLSDEVKRLPTINVRSKIKSFDMLLSANGELRVIVSGSNNRLQLYSMNIMEKNTEAGVIRSITQCGHQSEVRSVCFSSDSLMVASGSGESVKLWGRESSHCLRTLPTVHVLCCAFVPNDRYVLVGLRSGALQIFDGGSGELVEEIPAHTKELWSICVLADKQGCVTGSGDTTVKSWSFELIDNPTNEGDVTKPKVLSLLHKHTLKLEETVLTIKVSPDMKFLAVGMLDCTTKIFFFDTFKFYLTLYGHKLPVSCMDISYDSTLIITGSADRNVKIWGMDFGDCHKSLFAHDDSVMSLQFIPNTHMFFTCGKDGKVKQWDADSFQKIITLPGHIGEAYSLAVSPNGNFLITCGSDRTLRLYERTQEPLVLQDVQEEERAEIENKTLATGEEYEIPLLPGLKLASRKTVGAEKIAENILECLEIIRNIEADDEPSELHPLMKAYSVQTTHEFLMAVFKNARQSDFEGALVLVPFSDACKILEFIPKLADNFPDQTELICQIVTFIFKIHHKAITNNLELIPTVRTILERVEKLVVEYRDMIGMNYYGLQLLQREIEKQDDVEFYKEAIQERKLNDRRKKLIAKRTHVFLS